MKKKYFVEVKRTIRWVDDKMMGKSLTRFGSEDYGMKIFAFILKVKMVQNKDNTEDFVIDTHHQARDLWRLRRRPQILNQKGALEEQR